MESKGCFVITGDVVVNSVAQRYLPKVQIQVASQIQNLWFYVLRVENGRKEVQQEIIRGFGRTNLVVLV